MPSPTRPLEPSSRPNPTPHREADLSTKPASPTTTPVTVLLDATDDVAVTRAALAAHHPPAGRVTVHPAPATRHQTLAFDILAALGKPPQLPGHQGRRGPTAAWDTAAAWILALPTTRLIILRTHLLSADSFSRLLALRERTGVHLIAVCHTRHLPTAMLTALRHVEHHIVSSDDAGDLLAPAPHAPPPHHAAEGRWITVPALAYLAFRRNFPTCHCTPTPATRPYVPDRAYPLDQIAHRLATRTASPQLAAALAIAIFTAAPLSQLHTVHHHHFDAATSTLTLHDRYGTRRHGLATNCHTYTVPPWAHPFLQAAAHLLHLSPPNDGLLLPKQPHSLPPLTDFAEHCRLRPPQPATPPHPHTKPTTHKTAGPPKIQWYDGYLHPTFKAVSYEQWLSSAR